MEHEGGPGLRTLVTPAEPSDLADALEPTQERPDRALAFFIWAFAGILTMLCAWTFATPIGAAPDEPAQTVQAAAVVRGEFDKPALPLKPGSWAGGAAFVRVPCWVDSPWLRNKYSRCVSVPHTTTGFAPTQFTNYPPLYYVVVGLPSLALAGTTAIYTMRLTGDVLNAALVALGLWLLLRFYPRRTPLAGALLALSPMVLFLMSVLNESGLEIAAGFATWCGALCVAVHPRVPRALAGWTAGCAVLLVLSRPTSPADLLVVVIVLSAFLGWREVRSRLNRSLHPLWIPVAVSVVVAAVFLAVDGLPTLQGAPPPHMASLVSNMATTVRLTGGYLEQSIGDFGWVDLPAPTWVMLVWATGVAALTILALALSAACRRALPTLALAVLAMTVALEAPKINTVGTYFQGRYILPLLVGFPLLACCFEWRGRRRLSQRTLVRATVLMGTVLLAGQIAAFGHALDVYGGGRLSPRFWVPPGGSVTVQVVFALGAVVTFAFVAVAASRPPTPVTSSVAPRRQQETEAG